MTAADGKIYKTTIVIYSEADFREDCWDLVDIAREATDGFAVCVEQQTEQVDASSTVGLDSVRPFFGIKHQEETDSA